MTKVFISYAHSDDNYRKELEKHLSVLKRNGYIDTWTDREIIAGENWGNQIANELEEAKVILLLISSDFLASNYCYDIEMRRAIERHNKQEAIVIPIILRYCDWGNTPFSVVPGLPMNGKPIKDWNDQDQAFLNIVDGIKALLNSLQNNTQSNLSYGAILNPQIILSEIRKKLLTAGSFRELNDAKFQLSEYKKNHPVSFEVEELEQLIKKGLVYEERTMKMEECQEYYPTAAPKTRFPILLIIMIIIIILIIIIYFLFIK